MYVYFLSHILGVFMKNFHLLKHLGLSLFSNYVQNIKYLKRIKKIKSVFIYCSFMIYAILNSSSAYLIHECNKMSYLPSQILNPHEMTLHKFSHKAIVIILPMIMGSSNTRKPLTLPTLTK